MIVRTLKMQNVDAEDDGHGIKNNSDTHYDDNLNNDNNGDNNKNEDDGDD